VSRPPAHEYETYHRKESKHAKSRKKPGIAEGRADEGRQLRQITGKDASPLFRIFLNKRKKPYAIKSLVQKKNDKSPFRKKFCHEDLETCTPIWLFLPILFQDYGTYTRQK
jgi:hypothetical protein